jgi:hypothetical protein
MYIIMQIVLSKLLIWNQEDDRLYIKHVLHACP